MQLGAGARGGGSGVRSWAEAGERWGSHVQSSLPSDSLEAVRAKNLQVWMWQAKQDAAGCCSQVSGKGRLGAGLPF